MKNIQLDFTKIVVGLLFVIIGITILNVNFESDLIFKIAEDVKGYITLGIGTIFILTSNQG